MIGKTKEVVITQPYFVSNDGQEFEDEISCIKHELEMKCADFRLWDWNFAPVFDYHVAKFIFVGSKPESLTSLLKYAPSIKGIDGPGLYYFVAKEGFKKMPASIMKKATEFG